MKANEIMIGDWVNISKGNWSENWQVELTDIEMIAELVYLAEPIPLTAEILEKNGFIKNKYGEMILDEEIGTSEIYFVLELAYNEEYYWWKVSNELITKIKSVHELQHALRLCEIEKEIEL